MNNKTIMLVINQGFSSRYLLRSEIFQILQKSGFQIIILSPASKEDNFVSEFEYYNVFHELYEPSKYREVSSKIYQFFTYARLYSFKSKYYNNFTNYWSKQYFQDRRHVSFIKKLVDILLKSTIFILSRSMCFRALFIKIESLISPQPHQSIFRKYKPDLVVTTSLGMLPYDRFIMQEAKKNGAQTVSLVLSWDNTTTKGIVGAKVDHVVAWTETMHDEIVKFHDIPSSKVFVGGVVQYDEYFKNTNLPLKRDIFQLFNLSVEKKTIFYCLESPTSYKHNSDVLKILAKKIEMDAFCVPCQLVVRPHPIYFRVDKGIGVYQRDLDELKEIQRNYPFIVFDYPEVTSEGVSHDMPVEEVYKLGGLLKAADVVLCFYSSMNIEASIFDTPVINIDLFNRTNIPNDVLANHTHNKRVFATGGVASVSNIDELSCAIDRYLLDPERDTEGRKKIVSQESGPNHGCSANMIGNHLASLVVKR